MADPFTISYRSRSLLPSEGDGLEALVRRSQEKNLSLNVTGVLLFDGVHFMQTIEGPHAEISELFRSIMFDDRHADVIPFGVRWLEQRRFPDWRMLFIDPEGTREILPDLGGFEFTREGLFQVHHAARELASRQLC